MTPYEFTNAIAKIIKDNQLTSGEAASGLAGILVTLCEAAGEDPVAFMEWAVQQADEIKAARAKRN